MSVATIKPEMSSLFMDFAQYFEISLALQEEQKARVFEVRYHVYCEEFGYEDAKRFENGLEIDSFDERSLHCLVTHRASGLPAGCVRVVAVDESSQMPMEQFCAEALDASFFDTFRSRRESITEVSRLAVDGHFRRRRGEKASRFGNTETLDFCAREQRTFSLISLSLFLASFAAADLLRRPHCFAIMEPFLPAILRRSGLEVKRVGEDFEHRGTRAPYYLDVGDAMRKSAEELRLCFEVLRAQFGETLDPEGSRIASRGSAAGRLSSSRRDTATNSPEADRGLRLRERLVELSGFQARFA